MSTCFEGGEWCRFEDDPYITGREYCIFCDNIRYSGDTDDADEEE